MVASPGSAAYRGSWRYDRPNFLHEFVDDESGARLGLVYKSAPDRFGWAVYGPERPGVSTAWGDARSESAAKKAVETAVEKFES